MHSKLKFSFHLLYVIATVDSLEVGQSFVGNKVSILLRCPLQESLL